MGRMQNSRFFFVSVILACGAREPHTPYASLPILLAVFTLAPNLS